MYVYVLTISSQQLKQRVDAVLVGDPLNEELMNHQGPTMVSSCIVKDLKKTHLAKDLAITVHLYIHLLFIQLYARRLKWSYIQTLAK